MLYELKEASISMLATRHRPQQLLRIYEWEPSRSKVVVLVNAYAMPVAMWHLIIKALLLENYRIITWDTAGISVDEADYSEATDCSFDSQVRDLLEVINFSGSESVRVVGWCTGPLITLRAMFLEPNAITEAVSLAGCFNLLPPNAYQKSYRTLMGGISRSFRHAEMHRDLMNSLFGTTLPDGNNVIGIAGGRVPADVVTMVARPFESVKNLYTYSRLVVSLSQVRPEAWINRIERPVLMMVGGQDLIANPLETELAARSMPCAVGKIYPDRDHYCHFREPDIAEEIVHFFDEHIRSQSQIKERASIGGRS